jgi:ATP-binding cassette subfamily C protein
LDEPNSNLDAPGSEAVNAAIREMKARGSIVVIMAHRPAAIAECDLILMMKAGQLATFGPRDEVLRRIATNHSQIVPHPLRTNAGSWAGNAGTIS